MNDKKFAAQVQAMHNMYCLDSNAIPTTKSKEGRSLVNRLTTLYHLLLAEVEEIDEINIAGSEGLDALAEIAGVLGNLVVYCHSEALKYGIPLDEVLNIIMESHLSRIGALKYGKPTRDVHGKVIKGPDFFPPEPKIRELIRAKIAVASHPNSGIQGPSTTIA